MTEPNTGRGCNFEGCSRRHEARGYCRAHYEQSKSGKPLTQIRPRALKDRFWLYVDKSPDGCWEWKGTKTSDGYGRIFDSGKPFYAHRISWEFVNPPLIRSAELDHMCHNRACVNPAHLRESTRSLNNQNRRGAQSNSSTGVRGVYRTKCGKKYFAQARLNRKSHYLGAYETKDQAEAVVVAWRRKNMPHSLKDQLREAA